MGTGAASRRLRQEDSGGALDSLHMKEAMRRHEEESLQDGEFCEVELRDTYTYSWQMRRGRASDDPAPIALLIARHIAARVGGFRRLYAREMAGAELALRDMAAAGQNGRGAQDRAA